MAASQNPEDLEPRQTPNDLIAGRVLRSEYWWAWRPVRTEQGWAWLQLLRRERIGQRAGDYYFEWNRYALLP